MSGSLPHGRKIEPGTPINTKQHY